MDSGILGRVCNIYAKDSLTMLSKQILDGIVDATENKNVVQDAFYKVCKKYLRAYRRDLHWYSTNPSHKKMKLFYPNHQQTLDNNVVDINNSQKEIVLAVHVAMHSSIKNKLKITIHRSKCAAMIKNVVAPCF